MPFTMLLPCFQVLPQVEQPQTGMNEGVKVGLIGIGALVALGGAFFVARKLLSSQLPKVQKVSPYPLHPWHDCSCFYGKINCRNANIKRWMCCHS